ncbi:hypothetical protein K458DRAFT_473844 [Lentithecium fluviatile CBS 122367]|uniref:Uncharacterized protein n=1 Tax=Lentithecium fluviatile CBS 122367 TaxID=1168545 RepID=A0A6G1JJI6_9PLEO|nr:hypothetical protein K458DRAFT_473844 [Lentithecium fluviatile CBS 122367]
MSNSSYPCASPPHRVAWTSLVDRSIAAWDEIAADDQTPRRDLPRSMLQGCHSLDDFHAQNDYVLLPALPGFVMRSDCFFVSHFWRTQEHPDPDGEYLCLHQAEFEPQTWSYIWVDWTCMPQNPRSSPKEGYFHRCLRTVSAIIRNCGFVYFHPPFEPRLWILYEITEYVLTCSGGIGLITDIEPFLTHMDEMLKTGVQATLAKHAYRCSFDLDRQYPTSRLELLVLLRRFFDIDSIRKIMDHVTWFRVSGTQYYPGVELNRYEGTLVVNGAMLRFTTFPQWGDGKYSQANCL